MSSTWSGRKVTTARARFEPMVVAGGVACWRCGRAIVHDPSKRGGGWTVGHIEDRALGGSETAAGNQWPEHPRCNYSAGGRLGAARRNAKRPKVIARMESEKERGIRGW